MLLGCVIVRIVLSCKPDLVVIGSIESISNRFRIPIAGDNSLAPKEASGHFLPSGYCPTCAPLCHLFCKFDATFFMLIPDYIKIESIGDRRRAELDFS